MQHEMLRSATNYNRTSRDLLTNLVQIGRGSFGTVFIAKHAEWGSVAYKRLNAKDEFVDQSCLNSVIKEVQAYSQLHHPNITQMIAIVSEPTFELGIVLWYEQHGNAFNFISNFHVDWPWKVEMMYRVSLGLNYLHTLTPPIIHGDIKVHNVLIGDDFVAKLSDFGLSKWRDYSTAKTRVFPRGTTTHIAPERLRDINARRNEKVDVYSFGILMWELLTGLLPFADNPETLIMEAVKSGSRPDRRDIAADVPLSVRDVMERCWADQPADRPSSREITRSLEAICTKYHEEIERSRYDLRLQDSCRRMSGSYSHNYERLPIQTISRGSRTSPGVAIPQHSARTNPSGPKQVQDSSSSSNVHLNIPASAVQLENNSQSDGAGHRSIRFSYEEVDRNSTYLPSRNTSSRERLPDLAVQQQHLPPVGQATRLTPRPRPVTGPRPVVNGAPVPNDGVTTSRNLPILPTSAAIADFQIPTAAGERKRSTDDKAIISGSQIVVPVVCGANVGEQVVPEKIKKSKQQKKAEAEAIAASIGRPTNFRHHLHIGINPLNGIFVSDRTTEVDRSFVVGNSQLSRAGESEDELADDFELVRITRPGLASPESTVSSSTVRYGTQRSRSHSDGDSALEY